MNYFKLTFYLLVFFSTHNLAEQLNYSRVQEGDGYRFNYQWTDQNRQAQSISFTLSKEALFERFRNFRVYKPKFAEQDVARQIKKKLTETPLADVQVNFIRHKGKVKIDIKSTDPIALQKAYSKIAQMEKTISKKFLKENYYQEFTTHDQIKAIKPNHTLIAQESVEDLKPLRDPILGTVSIKNIRKVTNYTLGFVQSIPYATLESRTTSTGAGFNPPLRTLWENQGDCDSKVTLTAAIFRMLMPRIKMMLVFIDNHALLPALINAADQSFDNNIEDFIDYFGFFKFSDEMRECAWFIIGQSCAFYIHRR